MLERNQEISQTLLHEQHLQLYRLVEQLDSVIAPGVAEQSHLARTLLELEEYTKVHFGDEEELMRIHEYHSTRAHRAAHNDLAMKIIIARQRFEAGEADVLASLTRFLHLWLTDHIEGWDRQFHLFLTARGLP